MSADAFDDLLAGIGAAPVVAGWYGKLPLLGDFAHRRLPQPVVDVFDGWLSQGSGLSPGSIGAAGPGDVTPPITTVASSPGVVGRGTGSVGSGLLMSVVAGRHHSPSSISAKCAGSGRPVATLRLLSGVRAWSGHHRLRPALNSAASRNPRPATHCANTASPSIT